jgi:hypothetical protein
MQNRRDLGASSNVPSRCENGTIGAHTTRELVEPLCFLAVATCLRIVLLDLRQSN